MKIKYLLVAVAMIGLTSFSNANLEETYIRASKQSSKFKFQKERN
jgi:cytochrome c